MSTVNNSWEKFTKRIPVNAAIEEIYEAWATPLGLERWFLKQADFFGGGKLKATDEFIAAGDTYKWFWHGYPEAVFEERKVLEANGKDLIRFTFSGDCVVSVAIKSEDNENVVELTQENIQFDDNPERNLYVGCGEGWTFYLANLKSILEGGIDLRNKNVNIKKVISS